MRKIKIRFYTIADYEDEELWLRRQHQNGWKLVKMTPPCFYTFEECEPEDVVYRLDFKNGEQTEEYLQMLRDFGWEYFFHLFGWLYFRKPASAAKTEGEEELFSDNASDPSATPKPIPDPAETKTVEPAPKPSQQPTITDNTQPTTTDNTQPANPAPAASQDTASAASQNTASAAGQNTASAADTQVASAAQAAVETAPVQVAAVDPAPKHEEGVVAGTKHAKEGSEATVAEKKEDAEPEIVTLDLTDISEDKAQVTKDILQEYAGKNAKLELKLSETAKWVIDASTIDAEKVQDIDLGIVRDADGIPAETLDAFMENPKLSEATLAEQISLRHDGPFGFSADLYLLVGEEYQGKYANLFYYNPETKALEFVAAKEVGEDGYAAFPFVHASDYAVIVDRAPLGDLISDPNEGVNLVDDSSEAVQSSEINVEEQTVEGGARWVGLMMILLIITAIIVVFLMVHMIYKADNPDYDNQYAGKKA